MKKVLAFVLSLCMLLPLVACGNNGSGNSGSGTAGNNGDDITAEHPITMVVAHDEVLDSPQQRAMEAFKEYVEAESGGRIVVELHANGELGDAATMANMIGMGSVQASTSAVISWPPTMTSSPSCACPSFLMITSRL